MDDLTDVEHLAYDLIQSYVQHEVSSMHLEEFEASMVQSIVDLMHDTLDDDVATLERVAHKCTEFYTKYKGLRTALIMWPAQGIEPALQRLEQFSGLSQRTPEWYQLRHDTITASAAFKLFNSPAKYNELIYEKCSPMAEHFSTMTGPRHWGVKYEPLSALYYEHVHSTKIKEYGLVIHPQYPFLGASPDGIVVDPTSPRYGCMVEIKNPTSREITGNPKTEYWIQVQLQLEVCDLEYCDFLETHFSEYPSEEEFEADGTFTTTSDGAPKGVFLLKEIEGNNVYLYPPFGCSKEEFETWETTTPGEWVLTFYWKLDEAVNTLIPRRRDWFSWALPVIEQAWATIVAERVTGYQHRAPKKRTKPEFKKD